MKNIIIKETLSNGYKIVEVSLQIKVYENGEFIFKEIKKYALLNDNNFVNLKDIKGNLVPILYFDKYELDKDENMIIGISKEGNEVYYRVMDNFDLSETLGSTETDYDLIGGRVIKNETYYSATKKIEDIIDEKYYYNYGVINKEGVLSIYPVFDHVSFANEDACIVGNLWSFGKLKYGYANITTGEYITPIEFYEAKKFFCGRAAVNADTLGDDVWGYVDRDKVMTDINDNNQYASGLYPRFSEAHDFENNVAKVAKGSYDTYYSSEVDINGEYVKRLKQK